MLLRLVLHVFEWALFDLFTGLMGRLVADVEENTTVSPLFSTYQCRLLRCADLNFAHPTQL